MSQKLAALPERDELLNELARNPGTRDQINQFVGTRLGGGHFQPEVLLFMGVRAILKPDNDLQFDKSRFAAFADQAERELFNPERTARLLIPLTGLRADGPIEFGDGLVLDRLDTDEILRLLDLGLVTLLPGGPHAGFFANLPPLWGLRFEWQEPKRIGPPPTIPADWTDHPIQRATVSAMRAVTALRLAHAGFFMPLASLQFVEFSGGASYSSFPRSSDRGWQYVLEPGDAAAVVQVWRELQAAAVVASGSIQNALRRFDFAQERVRPEDALIDLMIAAESLFLGDLDRREGELRYRMSSRAGWLLGGDHASRLDVFKRMRHAYDVRSDVVHGNRIDQSKLLRESPNGMRGFVAAVEELLRGALLKTLADLAQTGTGWTSSDWDDLVLG